jgi:hypothetical protein
MIFRAIILFFLVIQYFSLSAQTKEFIYDLDVSPNGDDLFHLALKLPQLTAADSIYSFVSFAPGVHQPLDFGRFFKSFKFFDSHQKQIM